MWKKLNPKQRVWIPVTSIFLIGIAFFMMAPSQKKKMMVKAEKGARVSKDIGISIGGADQQAYLARLEKNYYDFEDRMTTLEKQIHLINNDSDQLKKLQKDTAQSIVKSNANMGEKIDQKVEELKGVLMQRVPKNNLQEGQLELSVANVDPKISKNSVYLPIGSFCQGTLLTGVYAAADANNPLPVLISLDEAFYGPNKTRIPLKGAFVLGKAYGELVSERALIQIVALSTVLPNGQAFEDEQNLGYVTDEFGELGIKGQLIYNTGRQLALSFMGGFVSGGAQAMADSQVTTHQSRSGDITKNVTGSSSKSALFSGVAQSAGKLAQFYERQADDLVPAIHIKNGAKVFFIVQKGVTIHGLDKSLFEHKHHMD